MSNTKHQIWIEGHRANGSDSKATFHGEYYGESFKEAVQTFANDGNENIVNVDNLTYWGCRIFNNEQEARQSFG